MMPVKLNIKHPNFLIGVLFVSLLFLFGCNEVKKTGNELNFLKEEKSFLAPFDSLSYNYSSDSWKGKLANYSENRYGQMLTLDSGNNFCYLSIDTDNELHRFNFSTNEHSYSSKICNSTIQAYKIDSSLIYLLYDDILFIKNFQLNTIDSFSYKHPVIDQQHGIDFTLENNSNLFKMKDYFALMYYVVDELPDGSGLFKNSENLFYFFNKDTSFFSGEGCEKLQDSVFQYFRYPTVTNDNGSIYHAPRVLNCISKTSEVSTIINSEIDAKTNNYLTINHLDQYEISKLKKYRFSTDYNREIINSGAYIYLIKETPDKIYYENGVRKYKHSLELRKFDMELNFIKTYYIQNKFYSFTYIDNDKLYLFDIYNNNAIIYEL